MEQQHENRLYFALKPDGSCVNAEMAYARSHAMACALAEIHEARVVEFGSVVEFEFEITKLRCELLAAYENLTATQRRCTELLEENRALRRDAANKHAPGWYLDPALGEKSISRDIEQPRDNGVDDVASDG